MPLCERGSERKHTALQLAECNLCGELGVTARLTQLAPIVIKQAK